MPETWPNLLFATTCLLLPMAVAPAAANEVLLRCSQEGMPTSWYVAIPTVKVGAAVTMIASGQANGQTYRINEVTEYYITAVQPKQDPPSMRVLAVDRISLEMSQTESWRPEQVANWWNEEKKQQGGFEGIVTRSARYVCTRATKGF